MRLYIAAPLGEAKEARTVAGSLASVGHIIDSTWHREGGDVADAADGATRLDRLTQNIIDLNAAEAVVALMSWGNPRATNCEIGYALAKGKRVIWLDCTSYHTNANIFDAHPLVTQVRNVSECIAALARMQASAARETMPGVGA